MSDEQVNASPADAGSNGIPGSIPGETPQQTAARMYKVTVDGEEMEVDEQELLKGYGHHKAASKKMEEAAMTRKEAEQVLRIFKDNPKEAFKLLGRDARAFAEQVINDELNEALLTPEQRELRDYKAKVQAYEAEQRSIKEQYEKEQMDAQLARQAEQIQNDIISTLETSGLPKTNYTVGRIVYYMQAALQQGYNVVPGDVISYVKDDYVNDIKQMMGGLNEDLIESFLGQDLVRKVAKSTVQKSKAAPVVPKSVNAGLKEKKVEKKIMSPKDFFTNRH